MAVSIPIASFLSTQLTNTSIRYIKRLDLIKTFAMSKEFV